MSDLNENKNPHEEAPHEETPETEYHYVKPEQTRLYADADYVPQSETTVPPRYYVPPEKKPAPPKVKRERSPQKGVWWKVACMCLVCALLGGIAGGAIAWQAATVAEPSETADPAVSQAPVTSGTSGSTVAAVGTLTPEQIYEMACEQVVGVTTEVTYTNFFGRTSSSAVSGSGFFISSDGYILTNYHVIEYAYEYGYDISVLLYDGSSYPAAIVGVESGNDLAVLKIDITGANAVTFADSDSMAVGNTVYPVGNPLGELQFTMTSGIVSALDRSVLTSEYDAPINMFQLSAAINSGNSGGPVYNTKGEVVGVATAKYSSSSSMSSASVEGLSFAIPSNDAAAIANDLMTKGYVTGKARMGIVLDENYTSVYSQYYNLPNGAYVKYVENDSAAQTAGIASGDIITKLGDIEIASYSDLTAALKQYHAGDTATVTVYRSGEYQELEITFDEVQNTDSTQSITPPQAERGNIG